MYTYVKPELKHKHQPLINHMDKARKISWHFDTVIQSTVTTFDLISLSRNCQDLLLLSEVEREK